MSPPAVGFGDRAVEIFARAVANRREVTQPHAEPTQAAVKPPGDGRTFFALSRTPLIPRGVSPRSQTPTPYFLLRGRGRIARRRLIPLFRDHRVITRRDRRGLIFVHGVTMLNDTSLKAYVFCKDKVDQLKRDERGVTLIEYSILIGLITVAVIASVTAVGTWVSTHWASLKTALGA